MSRKQALSMYLLGTFGQVLGVSLLVWFLRAGESRLILHHQWGLSLLL